MKMVEIEFHGGVGEIGGNKILIKTPGGNIFLDFGLSFSTHKMFFSEFIQPRGANGLGDYFETGLLPPIPGIYRHRMAEHTYTITGGKWDVRNGTPPLAVLVSHAHADHIDLIPVLHESTAVVASPLSLALMDAMDVVSSREYLTLKPRYEYYTNKKGGLSRKTSKQETYPRTTLTAHPGKISLPEVLGDGGDLEVEVWPVDHSIPGAVGYILNVEGKKIVYTGDLRFHGKLGAETRAFVEKSRGADLLITEGTNLAPEKEKGKNRKEKQRISEKEVSEKLAEQMGGVRGHLFVNYPMRDLYRLKSILDAARSNGKELAVPLKQFYIIQKVWETCETLGSTGPDPFPSSGAELSSILPSPGDVILYVPKKSWGTIVTPEPDMRDYDPWEREVIEEHENDYITAFDIRDNPEQYVMILDSWNIQQLADVQPVPGGVYIKSSTEPFDIEMEIDWERIKNWLKKYDIKIVDEKTHASGHASGDEIKQMIEEIGAEKTFLIHTEGTLPGTEKPETGKTYTFG